MSQQGQEPNDANASSQASTAQTEPRATISVAATTSAVATTSAAATASAAVGVSPAAQDIVQSTHQSTRIEAQSRSKSEPTLSDTALEACLNGVFTTLIARGELEAEHTHKIPDPPTVEQVTALLADASFSVPDARLIVASPKYPPGKDSSIVRLAHTASDRVTFGVLQQPRNVDFVIKLPPSRRSTMMEVVCQIIFDPGSDNCLLRNWTYRPVNLTYLNSPPPTCGRACVGYKHSHVIQPGLWRISMYADEDRVAERHLIEFLLLGRQLTVAIRKAIDAPSAKRAADDDYGEHKDKRQRLEDNTAETITTLYKQNPSGVGLVSANINADNVDTNDHYLTTSSHIQEIINNPGVQLLQLKKYDTAIIRAPKASGATSYSESTVNGPATYQLQRRADIFENRNTIVFYCKHSAVSEIVVAKVLKYEGGSTHNVTNFAAMWKQEKEMLDMLKHRNIVDLKAFDGRQFAIYLEALPLSLSRGTKSPFSQSDAYTILRDVSSAFEYMSSLSIIHNDIKPHNIAYSPQRGPVLIDFGMATLDQDKPAGGTPWYLPPDMLYGNRRGFAGDVWALGITMLYILGKIDLPERGKDGWSLENLTEEDDPSRKKMKAWLEFIALKKSQLNQENTLESIVFRMLDWNGESRITAESILTELDFLEFDSGNDGESSDGSK